MHKYKSLLATLCVIIICSMMLVTASCGADESEYVFTTIPPKSTTAFSGTAMNTASKNETTLPLSSIPTTRTQRRFAIDFTGKVAAKRTIEVEAKDIAGYNGMRNVTSKQIVLDMRAGATYSNYLDSRVANESAFKRTLLMMKVSGFNAIRLPVTFEYNIDKSTYKISESYMKKVQKAVDTITKYKMYCILSLQNEGGWIRTDTSYYSHDKKEFDAVWKQLASRFKSYSDYLLFEGYSELMNTTDNPTEKDYDNLNSYAQDFVNIVRNSGGNNEVRHIVISSYGSYSSGDPIDKLKVPTDISKNGKNKMIIDIHLSLPAAFVGVSYADENDWGTDSDKRTLEYQLYLIKYMFSDRLGLPVIIGKYGAADKNNTADRSLYASYFTATAYEDGMTCFWNDDGADFALYERTTGQPKFKEIINAIIMSIQ